MVENVLSLVYTSFSTRTFPGYFIIDFGIFTQSTVFLSKYHMDIYFYEIVWLGNAALANGVLAVLHLSDLTI